MLQAVMLYLYKKKVMNIEAKITKLDHTKDTKYDVTIKTYKETISGVFEKPELRYLIQQIDNAIV